MCICGTVSTETEKKSQQTSTSMVEFPSLSPKNSSTTTNIPVATVSASTNPPIKDRLTNLKIIDEMLRVYDRRATPTNKIGTPTRVVCELFIRSFGSISEKTMDYQVDLYLRQHWEDPRLNHNSINEPMDLNDPKLVQAIWKPEVYFPNAKEGEFQYVTVPNVLLRIEPAGHILYMLRLKMKFSCMMELNKYPLDVQVCTMEVASFSKTTRELLLEWNHLEPVDLSSDLKMPQFKVEEVETDICEESSLIGNYSCLVAKFHLSRSIGFHMVQSYIPTMLIVIISWVSFWMDTDSVPGRTTLGVTTLLTVSSKSAGLNAETPQVSYVKAIDVWMGACTAFIFAALIEFTVVNYLSRKHGCCNNWASSTPSRRKKYLTNANSLLRNGTDQQTSIEMRNCERLNREGQSSHSLDTNLTQDSFKGQNLPSNMEKGQSTDLFTVQQDGSCPDEILPTVLSSASSAECLASKAIPCCARCCHIFCGSGVKVDEACRILFPLSFLLFNALYWWYYIYKT